MEETGFVVLFNSAPVFTLRGIIPIVMKFINSLVINDLNQTCAIMMMWM